MPSAACCDDARDVRGSRVQHPRGARRAARGVLPLQLAGSHTVRYGPPFHRASEPLGRHAVRERSGPLQAGVRRRQLRTVTRGRGGSAWTRHGNWQCPVWRGSAIVRQPAGTSFWNSSGSTAVVTQPTGAPWVPSESRQTMSSRTQDWLYVIGGIAIIAIAMFRLATAIPYPPGDIRSEPWFDPVTTGIGVVIGLVSVIEPPWV